MQKKKKSYDAENIQKHEDSSSPASAPPLKIQPVTSTSPWMQCFTLNKLEVILVISDIQEQWHRQ